MFKYIFTFILIILLISSLVSEAQKTAELLTTQSITDRDNEIQFWKDITIAMYQKGMGDGVTLLGQYDSITSKEFRINWEINENNVKAKIIGLDFRNYK